jgi:hypothetical protein
MVVRGRKTIGKGFTLALWYKVKALGSHSVQTMHMIGGTNNADGMEKYTLMVVVCYSTLCG